MSTEHLAADLGDLARALESQDDPDAVLEEVVAAAVRLIPGVQEGSISLVTGRARVRSVHPSGPLPEQVDALQTETGQGPCLDSVYEHRTVRVPDLSTEQRWPDFAHRASELGVGSMLSFQLYVQGDNLGALNLLSTERQAFDDESEQVGGLFASHAAIAFAAAQKIDHLGRAVETRDLIGQAKGMLMERYGIGGEQAFTVLTRSSSFTGRKLRDVAQELVATHRLPMPEGHDVMPAGT